MKQPLSADKKLGILYIIISAFGFALMSVFIRLAGDLPVMQKAFFRNLVAVAAAIFVLVRSGIKPRITRGTAPLLLARCFFGTCGLFCNYYGIDHLNLADANMLNKLAPFFTTLFSALLLKERTARKDWLAMAAAFIGMLFVIRPGFSMSVGPALIAALGGMCAGMAYTFVRKLGTMGVAGPLIILCFSVFSCAACLPFILTAAVPMTAKQLIYLLLAGGAATIGQFGVTSAYAHAPAKEISVFDYTQILFSSMFSIFIFDQIPVTLSFIGYAIIIGVAIWKAKQ